MLPNTHSDRYLLQFAALVSTLESLRLQMDRFPDGALRAGLQAHIGGMLSLCAPLGAQLAETAGVMDDVEETFLMLRHLQTDVDQAPMSASELLRRIEPLQAQVRSVRAAVGRLEQGRFAGGA